MHAKGSGETFNDNNDIDVGKGEELFESCCSTRVTQSRIDSR